MARTLIDIDDEMLAKAAQVLGTTTKVATVNRALAEVAGRGDRMAFLDHMLRANDDLGDETVMGAAWE